MNKIKKVTFNDQKNILFRQKGVKYAEGMCMFQTCHQQCTCQFADSVDQYELARDYYLEHADIW